MQNIIRQVGLPDMSGYFSSVGLKEVKQKNANLVSYDIISPYDPDRQIVSNIITGKESFKSQKMFRAFGAFAGTIIGDSLGYLLEGTMLDYKRDYLKGFENLTDVLVKENMGFLPCMAGQYTDATALSLCIADSLIANDFAFKHKDVRYRFHHWYFSGYNNGKNNELSDSSKLTEDVGNATYRSMLQFIDDQTEKMPEFEGVGGENGNATVMRIVSIPIAYSYDIRECMRVAVEQSYTTHNGKEAAECCRLLAFIMWNFINLDSLEGSKVLMTELGSLFHSDCRAVQSLADSKQETKDALRYCDPQFNRTVEDRDWNWKNPNFKYSSKSRTITGVYCMDVVAMSLHIIYQTKTFKDAVAKAANLGGDSGKIGAVVGMLAGALYGFDESVSKMYLEFVTKWDEQKAVIRAYKLCKCSEEKVANK